MKFSTERLARSAARHPWRTLGMWAVLLVVAIIADSGIADVLTEDTETAVGESSTAAQLIEERLRGPALAEEFIIVESQTATVDEAALTAIVGSLVAELRALDEVESAVSYLDGAPGLLSGDGRVAMIPVTLGGDYDDATVNAEPLIAAVAQADATQGFRVTTMGNGSINGEFIELVEETLVKGETIGIALALVILLLVFGAAVAAGLPVILALASIIVAVGASALVGRVFELSMFVTNIITMIGLAVGIDYSLFVVQRFREERDAGSETVEAVTRAGATASRAVLFSGIAVAIALSGMLIVPDPIFNSIGIGAILVVIAAVAAALTLLPAILSLLGDRVNKLTLPFVGRRGSPENAGGFWGAIVKLSTARPVVSVVVTSALLLSVGAWYFTINLGSSGVTALPADSNARHAFEVVDAEFARGLSTADVVVSAPDVRSPQMRQGVERLTASLASDDAFGALTVETNEAGDLALIEVGLKGDISSPQAHSALDRLRGDYVPAAFDGGPAEVYVGGRAAEVVDSVRLAQDYLPIIFAFVLSASFVLLLVAFRSIVVLLKAVVMNLLSVGAAYGLLVLVFQEGIGAGLLGFQQTPIIEAFLPMFLFTVLFGLSMDYHVFLLSRIKERYDETGDNSTSVAYGLRATGRIITGAALIMVAVFGGFALGDLVMMQQMGFGLAVAIILDATIVRMVLVPASMELLGDWNWYFPNWLEWLPRINIEGARVRRPATAAMGAGGGGGGGGGA